MEVRIFEQSLPPCVPITFYDPEHFNLGQALGRPCRAGNVACPVNAQDNVEIVSADTATVDIDVANPLDNQPGLYGSEMIAKKMPVAEVHASTIVEIEGGLATAWFGGTKEKARDVVIWMSRNTGNGWSKPIVVADGVNPKDRTQQACWNPVLFKQSTGSLILFYKVGPSPTRWWGMMKRSDDDGVTWKKPVRLPDGFVGPVKNKPIELSNRTLLCGSSLEDAGWRVQVEKFIQNRYWSKSKPLNSPLDHRPSSRPCCNIRTAPFRRFAAPSPDA